MNLRVCAALAQTLLTDRARSHHVCRFICLLFIVTTPAGNWLFGTAPVGVEVWLAALALAVLMGGMEEARKAWLRAVPDR